MELEEAPFSLSDLPGPAFACIIRHLIDLGSGCLSELLRCSKEMRAMVFEAVPSITYRPGSASDTVKHPDLGLIVRRVAPVALAVEMHGCDGACMARMLGGAGAAPWTAVAKLSIWGCGVPHTIAGRVWGALLAAACPNLRVLELEDLLIAGHHLLSSLAACPQLCALSLGSRVHLDAGARAHVHELPGHAPRLVNLMLWSWGTRCVMDALAPQLTHLTCQGMWLEGVKDEWADRNGQQLEGGLQVLEDVTPAPADTAEVAHLASAQHPPQHQTPPPPQPIPPAPSQSPAATIGSSSPRDWLDVLLALPALRHVTLIGVEHLRDPDGPRQPCSWSTLRLPDYVAAEVVPLLPLGRLERLELVGLQVGVRREGRGGSSSYAGGAISSGREMGESGGSSDSWRVPHEHVRIAGAVAAAAAALAGPRQLVWLGEGESEGGAWAGGWGCGRGWGLEQEVGGNRWDVGEASASTRLGGQGAVVGEDGEGAQQGAGAASVVWEGTGDVRVLMVDEGTGGFGASALWGLVGFGAGSVGGRGGGGLEPDSGTALAVLRSLSPLAPFVAAARGGLYLCPHAYTDAPRGWWGDYIRSFGPSELVALSDALGSCLRRLHVCANMVQPGLWGCLGQLLAQGSLPLLHTLEVGVVHVAELQELQELVTLCTEGVLLSADDQPPPAPHVTSTTSTATTSTPAVGLGASGAAWGKGPHPDPAADPAAAPTGGNGEGRGGTAAGGPGRADRWLSVVLTSVPGAAVLTELHRLQQQLRAAARQQPLHCSRVAGADAGGAAGGRWLRVGLVVKSDEGP